MSKLRAQVTTSTENVRTSSRPSVLKKAPVFPRRILMGSILHADIGYFKLLWCPHNTKDFQAHRVRRSPFAFFLRCDMI